MGLHTIIARFIHHPQLSLPQATYEAEAEAIAKAFEVLERLHMLHTCDIIHLHHSRY